MCFLQSNVCVVQEMLDIQTIDIGVIGKDSSHALSKGMGSFLFPFMNADGLAKVVWQFTNFVLVKDLQRTKCNMRVT